MIRAKKWGDDEQVVIIHDSGEVIVKIDNRLWKADVGTDFSPGTMAVVGILHEEITGQPEKEKIAAT
jgi:hypothetical protein